MEAKLGLNVDWGIEEVGGFARVELYLEEE
jgi:hypothetical protein